MARNLPKKLSVRDAAVQDSLSATIADWGAVPNRSWLAATIPTDRDRPLNPGFGQIVLATFALISAIFRGRNQLRGVVFFLTSLTLIAMILSLGRNFSFFGYSPWSLLCTVIWPLESIRSVYRFAYLVQLGTILMAAVGIWQVQRLSQRLIRRWQNLFRKRQDFDAKSLSNKIQYIRSGSFIAICMLVAGIVMEIPPPTLRLISIPSSTVVRPWIQYIKANTDGGPILCLPMIEGKNVEGLEIAARWMIYGTEHRLPIVGGYSGFFPQSWHDAADLFSAVAINQSQLDFIQNQRIKLVVIDTASPLAPRWTDGDTVGPYMLNRVFADAKSIEIWQITMNADPRPVSK